MALPYTAETITSPDGIPCRVLDVARLDFSYAAEGRKTALTLVRRAEGGERIETRGGQGKVESVYVAQAGDAIFVNLHDANDVYVPGDADGTRWKFSELEKRGYEIAGDDAARGGILVRSTATARLLHEAVRDPTCIKDAWGDGKHQFFFEGATLKADAKGRVTGIDKSAFDATWEITTPAAPPPAGRPPRP